MNCCFVIPRSRGYNSVKASLEGVMKSRNLSVAVMALASSLFLLAGTASAHGTAPTSASTTKATCEVHSLPSFIAQGEFGASATAADIIEVECDPTVYGTGSPMRVTDFQLFSRCKTLTWIVPNPFSRTTGPGVEVRLDADGNATVAVVAGPGCQVGETLVSAHMLLEPFETFTTPFTVLPPVPTTPGVFALPNHQVEDAFSSGFATIIQAEFKQGSEKFVRIGSEELFARCRVGPKLRWFEEIGPPGDGAALVEVAGLPELTKVQLDNDGNAFVIAVGDSSCAEGPSLIEADLESKPFTTFTTEFNVEAPRPTI
jgi:hypothetical protein